MVQALGGAAPFSRADRASVQEWLHDGTWGPLPDDLDLNTQAALQLARARQPGVAPALSRTLHARAAEPAVLSSVVSEVGGRW